jgi:hypothetical protein
LKVTEQGPDLMAHPLHIHTYIQAYKTRLYSMGVSDTPKVGQFAYVLWHWTGDQTVARPQHTHRTTQTQKSMPRVGLEPTTPVFERAKTVHDLDHAATLIGPLYSPASSNSHMAA